MSLTEVLEFRYPFAWVQTNESERLIHSMSRILNDRSLYVFDALKGLTVWDPEIERFQIVTIVAVNPNTEEEEDVPLYAFDQALMYAISQKSEAVFLFRNFHKAAEDYFNLFATLYSDWYSGMRTDDTEQVPLSIICLAPDGEDIPIELASFFVSADHGFPTEAQLTELLTYINDKVPSEQPIVGDGELGTLVEACRGMTEFDVINTVFSIVKKDGEISPEEIERLKYERLKRMSQIEITKPKVSLDDIGGLDNAKEIIRTAQWIRDNPDVAQARNVRPINKILMLGVPGTGKSFICEGAANTLGLDLAKIGVSKAMTKWVGESERNLRYMFQQVNALAPIAVWVDELGRDFQPGYNDGGTTQRVHGELLTALQELPDTVALFAAANDISSLPPEMLRAERFDKILFVGYPALEEREEIFQLNLGHIGEFDWEELAAATPFFTGAEIVQMINDVSFALLRRTSPPQTTDFVQAARNFKNRLWIRHKGHIQAMYNEGITNYEWASTLQRREADFIVQGKDPNQMNSSYSSGVKIKV